MTLTKAQQALIDLQTDRAKLRDMDIVLLLNGRVEPDPNRHAHVTSRIEGRVEKLYANVGDRVEKGQKLTEIQSRQIGDPPPVVTVTAPISGIVNERGISLGSAVEPSRELFHIIDLSQVIAQAEVYIEMFAKVAVVLGHKEGILAVPRAAVLEAGGEKFVFVQTGDTFDRVDVQTGAEDDRFIEIKDGLIPGDLVVTQGNREVYTQWLTGGKKPAADKD